VKRRSILISTVFLLLILNVAGFEYNFAKDDLDPEKLIAEHLKSLGGPEGFAKIKTRRIEGKVTLKFVTGGQGPKGGDALLLSETGKMGIIFSYKGSGYRGVRSGEYYAYDSQQVAAGASPLATFLYSHTGIVKNGLLFGTLNVNWPLLKESQAKAKCHKRTIDKKDLLELEYIPRESMSYLIVKIYFDPTTYYHVMTTYCWQVSGGYVLTEKFEDFRKVDSITLPYRSSINLINFSLQGSDFEGGYVGRSHTLEAVYTFEAEKIAHNEKIDPQYYHQ